MVITVKMYFFRKHICIIIKYTAFRIIYYFHNIYNSQILWLFFIFFLVKKSNFSCPTIFKWLYTGNIIILYISSPSFHWPVALWSWTVTASWPVYGLNPVPVAPEVDDDMLLPSLSREHGDLGNDNDNWLFRGIVYRASAKSAARFKITS